MPFSAIFLAFLHHFISICWFLYSSSASTAVADAPPLTRPSAGLYAANSNVIQLTAKNFAQEVLHSDHVWLVEFYAPWCTHRRSV